MAKIAIDAPRERVYGMVADLAMRPAYCDHFMTQFRLQRIDSTGIGAAARFHVDAPRFPIWIESVISELEPPHLVLESGHGSRIDRMAVGTAWELVETAGDVCEVTASFWTEAKRGSDKFRDRLVSSGWYERQWRQALTRLRDLAEADAAIEPLRVAGASRP